MSSLPFGYEPNFCRAVGRPMEIALIEDDLRDAGLTIEALRSGQVKHRLTLLRDGAEALMFLGKRGKFAFAPRPDLILLDLRLPKIDGIEALAEIKANYDLQSIPIVALTGSDDEQDRVRCQRLGVEAYLTKPVNLEEFLGLVKQLKNYWLADVILPAVA